ncbi:hypothetical protein BKA58DRAFT_241012 [Alternaria rosae]|uniref:uncharacterized protein n=1 Tax=Alternaria rosae TaxID=1187941 RepID=UPI001E8E1F7D|nr:uncharacterized protein BKA58DRAFT_241012 [Alternaria rosae]KAH6865209.1 hypothetical protein BKA58DRAFT_241012 [Alternaria rosae]
MLDPNAPQPEWNHQFQRYLHLHFNISYQRWFWNHYDGQNWVFFDWVPLEIAPPVPQPQLIVNQTLPAPSHHRFDSAAGPAGTREGTTVFGSYDGRNALPTSHYESLDPSFYVRDSTFFIEGRVFSILFSEAAGANAVVALRNINNVTDYNSSISMVKYRELVHTQVRRFIVVKRKREFCFAVPIFTYQGQGTKKQGVSPTEHAIAFSHGYADQLLPGEAPLTKHPICIVMNNGERRLAIASRIYFGIHHPIQYNVKVKDLGVVHQDWLATFLGYWNMENLADTQQSNEITNEAAQGEGF